MNWAKITLFLAGLFFGGAIDHVIVALLNSQSTPYGLQWGIAGNWAFAALDTGLTGLLYGVHRGLEARAQATSEG
jgi:hypothetical protein